MRRASSSILASGCAFTTTACRISTPSAEPTDLFSAALNRLGDEMRTNFGRLGTQMSAFDAKMNAFDAKMNAFDAKMNAFDANVKTEMKDVRTEMKVLRDSVTSDIRLWFQMNGRIIQVSIGAGVVALAYAVKSSLELEKKMHGIEVKAACADARSQTASELLAGAMSGDVFTENVKSAAHQRSIEPRL